MPSTTHVQDRLYEEMLWSDPRTGLAGKQLSSRGAGIEFGQDVTFDFLRTNQLALIVRSHECVNEGACVRYWCIFYISLLHTTDLTDQYIHTQQNAQGTT